MVIIGFAATEQGIWKQQIMQGIHKVPKYILKGSDHQKLVMHI